MQDPVETPELTVDLAETARFLRKLTGDEHPRVTFQTFPDSPEAKAKNKAYRAAHSNRDSPEFVRVLHGSLDVHADTLSRFNERGSSVCVVVNETTLREAREESNILRVRALFMDFDDPAAKPFDVIAGIGLRLEPHIVVESSPGKAHAYWFVTDCDLSDFKPTQQALIERYGSDKAVKDLPRVMRLPGFIHRKCENGAAPFRTRIMSVQDSFAYTLAEAKAGLLPATTTAAATTTKKPDNSDKPKKIKPTGGRELTKIESALAAIPTGQWDERGFWLDIGMALHSHAAQCEDDADASFALWCASAQKSTKFDKGDSQRTWDSFSGKKNGKTLGTLYYEAKKHGWTWTDPRSERFTQEPDGVYFHGYDSKGEPRTPLPVCGPLKITAVATDQRGQGCGLVLEFQDRWGRSRVWVMPAGMLAGDAVEVRAELLNRGLRVSGDRTARAQLSNYLNCAEDLPEATYTDTPGWHDGVYVTPDRTIGDGARRVLYQGVAVSDYRQSGTLDEWRNKVAALATGNSRVIFAISAAFAAPLLHMAGVDSGGFHFVGDSSQGKTSIALAAISVWSDRSFIRNWRATANGLEGVAQMRNDGLLVLDELNQVEPREAGEAAYMLANGRGKARAGRTGAARPAAEWRLLYLSTGELSLAAHMAKAGHRVEAGQEVRLVEIQADAEHGFGVYDTLNGRADGAALSVELAAMAQAYHGAVGVKFLEHLARDVTAVSAEVKALCKEFSAKLLPEGEGQARRVAARFALVAVAGTLATRWGLTGWADDAAFLAAQTCMTGWLDGRGGAENQERRAILNQVRKFLEQHGASRFTLWTAGDLDSRVHNQAGFRKPDKEGATFYVFPSTFKNEICLGRNSVSVAKLLSVEGWIISDGGSGKTSQVVHLPGIGAKRCYVFTPAAMQTDIDAGQV
jgi:putative DNA primase/helicase